MAVTIHGTVADGFEHVRDVFEENFAKRGERGASVCVWYDGEVVVDLWGGIADKKAGAEWQRDTIATCFSATKGVVAVCFLMLADRGLLDYDKPVAAYWPEFAAAGKQDITVRTLLNHRGGLIGVDRPISLDALEHHPEEVAGIMAEQAPTWEPGTDQGYHGVTYGLYAAELFRRITGESVGTFLAREVCEPLGAEVHLGLPPDLNERVATNYPATTAERMFRIIPKLLLHRGVEGRVYRGVAFGRDTARAFRHPKELGPTGIANFNTARVRSLELPWANAVANARGLCRIYSALANGGAVDGVRLMAPELIAPLTERQSWSDMDRVLRKPMGWSQGFIKEGTDLFSPNPESFGHPGAGGSLGWCDPKARIAIGYVMNKMDHRIRSPRAIKLSRAAYCSAGLLG